MRYAAALVESSGRCPVFLMNVPSTWQTAAVRNLYRDELQRLGRFLVELGGSRRRAELAGMMLAYDQARGNVYEAAADCRPGSLPSLGRTARQPAGHFHRSPTP